MNKETEHELAELHEKERSLEKALELVREKIRELVNYTNKNKGQKWKQRKIFWMIVEIRTGISFKALLRLMR